jgi:hypothetical protein
LIVKTTGAFESHPVPVTVADSPGTTVPAAPRLRAGPFAPELPRSVNVCLPAPGGKIDSPGGASPAPPPPVLGDPPGVVPRPKIEMGLTLSGPLKVTVGVSEMVRPPWLVTSAV